MNSERDPYAPPPSSLDSRNPYAPPESNVDGAPGESICRREGKVLYIQRGSDLPARCVKCNLPAVLPIKSRKLYWHHPGYYLLFLLRIFPYVIIALIVRKTFVVSPGLCSAHAGSRRTGLIICWSVFALGIASIAFGITAQEPVASVLAIPMLLVAIVMAFFHSRLVHAVEIRRDFARVKGCGEPFLASIGSGRRYD